ncbi:MAG: TIGR02206 family membrane protein [Clostridia bacterium]|nr:TIGR02206 family membrane protein [Clostridia bacterium]
MKNFFHYFFGQGTEVEFENFTFAHLAPILVAAALITLIYLYRDKLAACKNEHRFRYAIAFIMIISEMSYYWRLVGIPELGPNPVDHLPIFVCGWAVIFGSYMIVGKNQYLFDICYFWALCGTIFALMTPTVLSYAGPTRFRYYQFWTEHLIGYIGIFYLIFVHKMRPNIRSMVRSYVWLAILAVIAYIANTIIGPGANYLFMARPESTPSVLDILPANFALRLLIMAAVVTALFFVAYLPWYLIDRKAKKES